jgi:hypothetical protein
MISNEDDIPISEVQALFQKRLIESHGPKLSKAQLESATSNLKSDATVPHYSSDILDHECGFHLNVEYANSKSTEFISKSFMATFTAFRFLDENLEADNFSMLLAIFSGSRLDGGKKIKWNNNYKLESHVVTIHQLYYVFYSLMYKGIIKITADLKNNPGLLKSQIIKRLLNAFEPSEGEFPEYEEFDDCIKFVFDRKSHRSNGLEKMLPPKKPSQVSFEEITQTFISINLYSIKSSFDKMT